MADSIKIKSGALGDREKMPTLQYDKEKGSEIAFRTDTEELFIGTSGGNKRLCGVGDMAEIDGKLNNILSQISIINGQISDITARLDALTTPSE